MKMYDYLLSPSCYKARLLASLLGVRLELRPVDFHPGKEHHGPAMLALNPAGTIPILTDGDLVLTDSSAILTYIAAMQGPDWLGEDDAAMKARVTNWMAFSARLTTSAGGARLHDMLGFPGNINALRKSAVTAIRELEQALDARRRRNKTFLVADRPTIADIACFPYVALAPDGGIGLDPYPSVRLWMRAIRALPGFIEMPGIHRLHEQLPEPGPMPDVIRKAKA